MARWPSILTLAFLLLGLQLSAVVSAPPARAGSADKEAVSGPIFVEMQPLSLPMLPNDNGRARIVSVFFALEVADADSAAKVESHALRLTDAYIERLYGLLERRGVVYDGIVDLGRLKDEIMRTTTEVVGEQTVTHVLVQNVSQQSM